MTRSTWLEVIAVWYVVIFIVGLFRDYSDITMATAVILWAIFHCAASITRSLGN